jgi:protein-disulfide isomerase
MTGNNPQSPDRTKEQIFADWFERGKPLKEAFFNDLHLDINKSEVEAEFQKHEAWKEKTQLRATPTILVNGYKLPDNYKIEDLRYFERLKMEDEKKIEKEMIEFDVNIK